MTFERLVEPISSTYTYLLGCEQTRKALLIDPVQATLERDLSILSHLGLVQRRRRARRRERVRGRQ